MYDFDRNISDDPLERLRALQWTVSMRNCYKKIPKQKKSSTTRLLLAACRTPIELSVNHNQQHKQKHHRSPSPQQKKLKPSFSLVPEEEEEEQQQMTDMTTSTKLSRTNGASNV